MKKFQQATLALITAISIFICSCWPNGDGNSMDMESNHGEGAVDSTRIPEFDSSHASLSVPNFHLQSFNTIKV